MPHRTVRRAGCTASGRRTRIRTGLKAEIQTEALPGQGIGCEERRLGSMLTLWPAEPDFFTGNVGQNGSGAFPGD